MLSKCQKIFSLRLVCIALAILLFSIMSKAATTTTTSTSSIAGGTLTWTQSITPYSVKNGIRYVEVFANFQFTYQSTTYNVSGTRTASYCDTTNDSSISYCDTYIDVLTPLTLSLPLSATSEEVANVTLTPNGDGTASISLTGYTASGYANPKYRVLGVYYVVPGASSSSEYCNNTTTGTTDSIISTISSSYTNSYSVQISSSNIFKYLGGSSSKVSYSNTYSQSTSDGKSVAVSSTSSNCLTIPGPTNNYLPNNHDYDLIAIWLNPVINMTIKENSNKNITSVVWNGYGYNALDVNSMDVVYIYAGCLNGDSSIIGSASCTSNLAPLARTWDTDETWPSGEGPALTTADLNTVLSYDPYAMCTPLANATTLGYPTNNCNITLDTSRFTLTNNEVIPYSQPVAGAQPITTSYSLSYSISNTSSSSYTTSKSQTFGIEKTFSFFSDALKITTGNSQTFTSTTETNHSLETTNSQTTTASVTGPPCTVSGSACNPLYPSSGYPGPTEFELYEDNLFGTFLLLPVNWSY